MSFLYIDDGYTEGDTYFDGNVYVEWGLRNIYVPREFSTLVQTTPTEIRQMDITTFWLTLKDLEDDEDGVAFPNTHQNNSPVSVGGVTLARVLEIINGYTITFEDGQYTVQLTGANSNIADVTVRNQVSVASNNSAGLVVVTETVTGVDVNVISVDGTAVTGPDDFKADIAPLL